MSLSDSSGGTARIGQPDPATLDRSHLWHPFTPNDPWLDLAFEPVVITRGSGSELFDTRGNRYLDGNSSIWTNLHGHARPELNSAISAQLDRIAHSSFLGITHDRAPALAARLANIAGDPLQRLFFSDDGSTAMEAALKIVYQYFQQNGAPERRVFVSLGSAYHGDTIGAMSLGHSPLFHRPYRDILFPAREVMPPACYRCPYNEAKPEKADARTYRKCRWQCVDLTAEALGPDTAALVIEPRVQGAAGFLMHPQGYLAKASAAARATGAKLILDEVMTGCGRTGPFFAFQKESDPVIPDLVATAKGLSGGTIPFAATFATEELFQGFGGTYDRTFFHGHSYTGNQTGCAAADASLDLLEGVHNRNRREQLGAVLGTLGQSFWSHQNVGDVRREGTILAVELVEDFATRTPFDPVRRLGAAICSRARQHGLLTRPVGDILLLMPPYCTTQVQIEEMATALRRAMDDVL